MTKPSKPFPNGSSYQFWHGAFCERCKKYLVGDDGWTLPGNCKTERAIGAAEFNPDRWPKDDIVETSNGTRVCLHFESDNPEIMRKYKDLFTEESDERI